VGNIIQCQCYDINLSIEEQAYINKQFADCLCLQCMLDLRLQYNNEKFAALIKKHPGH